MPKVLEESPVLLQQALDERTYLLRLKAAQIARQVKPGQFVHIKQIGDGTSLLRHPFGVARADKTQGTVDIIYRVVGEFTRTLCTLTSADCLSLLGPLGRGFDLSVGGKALLVGGGTGLAPLLFLASHLGPDKTDVLMGGRTKDELFWQTLYRPFVHHMFMTTDDGSLGTPGTVMALLPSLLCKGYERVYVCGPSPMMQAAAHACETHHIECQVSLERYMACGLGACLSCTCKGREKRLKVCTDGPVFWSKEVSAW